MQQRSLSWYVGEGGAREGGKQKDATWPQIENWLEQARSRGGTVTLDILVAPRIVPNCLQLRADGGNYLLMLGEPDGDDYDVRTFTNNNAREGRVEIRGDLWDFRTICTDFSIVKRAFREFFDSGDVSHDLLD